MKQKYADPLKVSAVGEEFPGRSPGAGRLQGWGKEESRADDKLLGRRDPRGQGHYNEMLNKKRKRQEKEKGQFVAISNDKEICEEVITIRFHVNIKISIMEDSRKLTSVLSKSLFRFLKDQQIILGTSKTF